MAPNKMALSILTTSITILSIMVPSMREFRVTTLSILANIKLVLYIMTLSIRTQHIITFIITTLSIVTVSIIALSIMTLSISTIHQKFQMSFGHVTIGKQSGHQNDGQGQSATFTDRSRPLGSQVSRIQIIRLGQRMITLEHHILNLPYGEC